MEDVIERLRLLDEGGGLVSDSSVIVASIELPVKVTKTNGKLHVFYSNSLVIPGLHKIRRHHTMNNCQFKFVGYCGYTTADLNEQQQISELLEPFDCYPIFPAPGSITINPSRSVSTHATPFTNVTQVEASTMQSVSSHVFEEKVAETTKQTSEDIQIRGLVGQRGDDLQKQETCLTGGVKSCGVQSSKAASTIENGVLDRMLDFCQNCLSPVFHSIIDVERFSAFDYNAWNLYVAVNKLWADKVCELVQDDHDIVWVHDYHLLMVPQLISRRNRRANLGFFLHCPFPTSDMFMCLPVRNDIIRSMLCSDLVGFHFFEYARHFLTVCKRLMAIDYRFNLGGFLCLEYNGRSVHLKIGHVNVQYQGMQQQLKDDLDIQKISQKIKESNQRKFIFLSVDRLDHLSGIKLKFQAYRYYLDNFAYTHSPAHACADNNSARVNDQIALDFDIANDTRDQHRLSDNSDVDDEHSDSSSVVLIQYAYPPRHTNEVTLQIQKELNEMADAINRDFGPGALIFHCRPIYQKEKWAALKAADCLLDASIRDGLNLIAFEYIACKGDKPSHIILSEFTGCSSTLTCCQRIHPWQLEDVASKMDFSYSTPPSNCREKWARDVAYLSANSMEEWATDFLGDVRRAKKTDNKIYMRCGFASTYRVLSLDENFRPLDVQECVRAYRNATRKRLLFFDHEGTLAPDRRHIAGTLRNAGELSASGARPSPSVREALARLSSDPNNLVYVFSGRPRMALEEWFGDIAGLGLCAEHGYYIRPAQESEWQCMAPQTEDFVWKEVAMKLMQHYVKRTQGAFIENKGSALVFQYRNSDPDFGAWQAKELATYLEEFLFGMPVVVVSGKGYVEARIAGVSKGVACQWVIERTSDSCQFALAIGDDRSDEEMFQVLINLNPGRLDPSGGADHLTMSLSPKACQNNAHFPSERSITSLTGHGGGGHLLPTSAKSRSVYSVTVGKKPSAAQWYLNDTEEVSDLLDALIGQQAIGSFDVFDTDDTPVDFSCF